MLIIELRFPAGRYHATPWGRHVNEGVAEWPPSPYRLARALYDAWRRKAPDLPEQQVAEALHALTRSAPDFDLPPFRYSHTRSYLHQNKESAAEKKLVFDAFVVIDPATPVHVCWPDAVLTGTQHATLDRLLRNLDYLGRSESWVQAQTCQRMPDAVAWNCSPNSGGDTRVACIAAAADGGGDADLGKWLAGLTVGTADLFRSKTSDPPLLRFHDYDLPRAAPLVAASVAPPAGQQGVRFALHGKVLPLVTDTLLVAERVRAILMGTHKRLMGDDPARLSRHFAGKDDEGKPLTGHAHAFYLPEDRDGDGRLDHLVIAGRHALTADETRALNRLDTLWQVKGRPDVRLVPVAWGAWADFTAAAKVWRSVTPYVAARHHKPSRGAMDEWLIGEIQRELDQRGLAAIVRAEPIPSLLQGERRAIRWAEFHRSRKLDAPKTGHGFEIEFAEPVAGPLALGYACHFGLGQFRPVSDGGR